MNILNNDWCCEDMKAACEAYLDCDLKGEGHTPWNCAYTKVYRSEDGRWGLVIHDGHDGPGSEGFLSPIRFCPFCGRKLAA